MALDLFKLFSEVSLPGLPMMLAGIWDFRYRVKRPQRVSVFWASSEKPEPVPEHAGDNGDVDAVCVSRIVDLPGS